MASIYDMTTAVAALKRLYPNGIKDIWFKADPLSAFFKPWTGFGGEGKFLAWRFGPGGAGSSNFASAQARQAAAKYVRPFITRRLEYGIGTIANEAMLASEGDANAIASIFQQAVGAARYSVARALAHSTLSDGTGRRAQVKVTAASVDIEVPYSDTGRFEIGMVVQASDNAGVPVLQAGTVEIIAIKPGAGGPTTIGGVLYPKTTKLTGAVAWDAGIGAIADNFWLLREGDLNNVSFGVPTWVPDVAPTGVDVTGVDRSPYPTRLAGIRYDATQTLVGDALTIATGEAQSLGTMNGADVAVFNPQDFATFLSQMNARTVAIMPIKDDPTVSFSGLEYATAVGTLRCISAPMQKRGRIHVLDTTSWAQWSLGEVPQLLKNPGSGSMYFTLPGADSHEIRLGAYFNRVCEDPGANMVINKPGGWR